MTTTLGKLWSLLSRRDRAACGALLAGMFLGAFFELLGVGSIPLFVTMLTNPERLMRVAPAARFLAAVHATTTDQRIAWASGALLALFLVKNTYLGVFNYIEASLVARMKVRLCTDLFRAYLRQGYPFHLQRHATQLLRNVTVEAERVIYEFVVPMLRLAMDSLVVIFVVVLVVLVQPPLSLMALTLLAVGSGVFLQALRARITSFGRDEHHYRGRMFQTVSDALGGIKEVKAAAREAYFEQRFARAARGYARATKFKTVLSETPALGLETIAVFGILAVAGIMVLRHEPAASIVPVLTLLAVTTVRLIPSCNRMIGAVSNMRYGRTALDVVHHDLVLATPALDATSPDRAPRPLTERLTVADVHFRYASSGTDALRSIDLEIVAGTAVAFVGASGSGKTTLADVILGLLRPTSGRVLVDGADVADDLDWQRQIGYVPQDVFILDDSVRRNVAFAIPDDEIDDARVVDALRSADLWQMISTLPDGLDTTLGERGARLSGGQCQRIGIARALYGDPQVLLMDEATSALDGQTETAIVDAIDALRGERTIIIIAHRVSTYRRCDRLFLLRDGAVVADGTFEALRDTNAEFRSLISGTSGSRRRPVDIEVPA